MKRLPSRNVASLVLVASCLALILAISPAREAQAGSFGLSINTNRVSFGLGINSGCGSHCDSGVIVAPSGGQPSAPIIRGQSSPEPPRGGHFRPGPDRRPYVEPSRPAPDFRPYGKPVRPVPDFRPSKPVHDFKHYGAPPRRPQDFRPYGGPGGPRF